QIYCTRADVENVTNIAELVLDDNWNEDTLKWINKPDSDGVLATWQPVDENIIEFEITAEAINALATDKLFSIRIYSQTTEYTTYASKEDSITSKRPQLIVTTNDDIVPLSAIYANRTLNEVTHQWYSVDIQEYLINDPIVITSIETYNGSDTAGVRIQELNTASMEVMLEEEQSGSEEIEHASEILSYFITEEGLIYNADNNIIGEAGKTVKDQFDSVWHTINTQETYTNPVVFAQILTYNGSHYSHIRLKNVQNNSFEMQIEEWDYLDGDHAAEDIGYIVLENGSHELASGEKLEVGTVATDENWENIYFNQDFDEAPITVSRCQTYNESEAVVTRQSDVSVSGFSVKLQEEEGNDDLHSTENIGYMAMGYIDMTVPNVYPV
ncbi:MAG: DNRLRE domain-containing protein, partial [Candidatus Pacebacteria bacterium]|nr:DNRLRE domain-containing protein [Candidatus Paceibacterota bacterium]